MGFFGTSMDKVLIEFFHNCQKIKEMDLKLPSKTSAYTGRWPKVISEVGDVTYMIEYERWSLSNQYPIVIRIKDITVFKDDSWVHEIPREVKILVQNCLETIIEFNKSCKADKLNDKYQDFQNKKENERKAAETKKHQEEQNRLIEYFKK